jgi:hypothetical protein
MWPVGSSMAAATMSEAHLLAHMALPPVARREINPFSLLRLVWPACSSMSGQVDQNSQMTALAGLGRCY